MRKINIFKRAKDINKEKTRLDFIKELGYDRSHGYSIIKDSKSLFEQEFIMQLAKQYDEYGYMSQELGEELDKLFLDNDYIIGIHRTGYTSINENILKDIFENGLINNGHAMVGAPVGQCDIEKTVSLFNDFAVLCGQLKSSHGYKCSEGCVIVRIPKECLYESDKEPMPMYYESEGVIRLLPQFIYGYVPVDREGKLGTIYKNKNYSEIPIKNENLLFDGKVSGRFKRNGYSIRIDKRPVEEKYNVLKKAYLDTLNKYGEKHAEYALIELINHNNVEYFSGNDNREYLESHVIYGDIFSILGYTMDDLYTEDINSIIQNFINSVSEDKITHNL